MIAVLVGAHVRVLHVFPRRTFRTAPIVLVFPVPGGPHTSSTEDVCQQLLAEIQLMAALDCDGLSLKWRISSCVFV